MRVLLFGTFDARRHPRVAVLASGLADLGATVDVCNVPIGLDTAARVSALQHKRQLPRVALRLLRCWLTLARQSRRHARPDVVLVGYLGHFDVLLARMLYPRTPIVLDHLVGAADTARDRRVQGGAKLRLLAAVDRLATAVADVVVVDTPENRAELPPPARPKAIVAPVGVTRDWASNGRVPFDGHRPLRVVFFGLFTPLQGAPVIASALATLHQDPRIEATLIGTGQDLEASKTLAADNPRIDWVDWVEPERLPELVAEHDVCLGIFGSSAKAQRVVPNKVYQGAAAGCALITSDTEPQRRALGDAAVLVPPADPAALAAALDRLASDPAEVRRLQAAAKELACREFLPDKVARGLTERLQVILASRRGWLNPRRRGRSRAS